MTSMDLTSDPDERIVARQLYASILDYMNSDRFRPEYDITVDNIRDLYTKRASAIDLGTKESPDELKPVSDKRPGPMPPAAGPNGGQRPPMPRQ